MREDLYAQLKKRSIPVRGIWIVDASNQGASGVLNEHVQGDNSTLHLMLFQPPSGWRKLTASSTVA